MCAEMDRIAFGAKLSNEASRRGICKDTPVVDRTRAGAAIHDKLHEWAAVNLPMGCGAKEAEKRIKQGVAKVESDFRAMPDSECRQQYGIPVLLIIQMIPTLYQIISMLWKWLTGGE
jgi:hypothetical protein